MRPGRDVGTWALDRGAGATRQMFEDRFGAANGTVGEFAAGAAAHVRLVDLTELLPELAASGIR
jgi:hypothetical protein